MDVQTGKQTGHAERRASTYSDIARHRKRRIRLAFRTRRSTFYKSDGTLDADRVDCGHPVHRPWRCPPIVRRWRRRWRSTRPNSNLGILDLPSRALARSPVPDVSFNYGLSISSDGKLVAVAQGDVEVVMTHAPWTTSTCVLDVDPRHPGGTLVIAFSPVDDKLAVSKAGRRREHLRPQPLPGLHPRVELRVARRTTAPHINHVAILSGRHRPGDLGRANDGVGDRGPHREDGRDQTAGRRAPATLVKELPIYQWQKTSDPSDYSPAHHGSAVVRNGGSADRLDANGPVQQWDVATATLLWSASL